MRQICNERTYGAIQHALNNTDGTHGVKRVGHLKDKIGNLTIGHKSDLRQVSKKVVKFRISPVCFVSQPPSKSRT